MEDLNNTIPVVSAIVLTRALPNGVTANLIYGDGMFVVIAMPNREELQKFADKFGIEITLGPGVEE